MIVLCQKCSHFEYWHMDEDNCLSGGCCTTVAFPDRPRLRRCQKFKLLTKVENLKTQRQRLNVLDHLRSNHEIRYRRISVKTTKQTVQRYKWRLEDYLFHRDLQIQLELKNKEQPECNKSH